MDTRLFNSLLTSLIIIKPAYEFSTGSANSTVQINTSVTVTSMNSTTPVPSLQNGSLANVTTSSTRMSVNSTISATSMVTPRALTTNIAAMPDYNFTCFNASQSCQNNGTCNTVGKCNCTENFTGYRCEYQNKCNSSPCKNNGSCTMLPNGMNYQCHCKTGDPTHDCALDEINECQKKPPSSPNGYITCINKIGDRAMICAPGYTGESCEVSENVTNYCVRYNCTDNEGYCKPLCNVDVCNGTSVCEFKIKPIDKNVSAACPVHDIADGYAHSACANESTLFDGFDKEIVELKDCSPYFSRTVCIANFGNGICNTECNNTDCLWDGWDCLPHPNLTPLNGSVIITFKDKPNEVKVREKLSLLLRAQISVKKLNVSVAPDTFFAAIKVNSTNFTSLANVGTFLATMLSKLPLDIGNVTDMFICPPKSHMNDTIEDDKCTATCGNCTIQGDICSWNTGKCLYGCQKGYWDEDCDQMCSDMCSTCQQNDGLLCTGCKPGRHGTRCDHVCDNNCLNNTCNYSTGQCDCVNNMTWSLKAGVCFCNGGFYGPWCNETCELCLNETCYVNGTCFDGCIMGNYGENCAGHSTDKTVSNITTKHQENKKRSDNLGVILGVVISVLLIAVVIIVACCYWKHHQAGDYIVDYDKEEELDDYEKPETVQIHANLSMQPLSQYIGASTNMVDMDEKLDAGVYSGPRNNIAKTPGDEQMPPESKKVRNGSDGNASLHLDGAFLDNTDSNPDNQKNTANGVTEKPRLTSSVNIEVGANGRLVSITDGRLHTEQSHESSEEEEEVFEDNQKVVSQPTKLEPRMSLLSETKAPLASEEDLLAGLEMPKRMKPASQSNDSSGSNGADKDRNSQSSSLGSSSESSNSSDRKAEKVTEI